MTDTTPTAENARLSDEEYGGLPWDGNEPKMRAALDALIAAREAAAYHRGVQAALTGVTSAMAEPRNRAGEPPHD